MAAARDVEHAAEVVSLRERLAAGYADVEARVEAAAAHVHELEAALAQVTGRLLDRDAEARAAEARATALQAQVVALREEVHARCELDAAALRMHGELATAHQVRQRRDTSSMPVRCNRVPMWK